MSANATPAHNPRRAAAMVQVHTPGSRNSMELPAAAITHMGKASTKDASSRLVLCSNYDAAEGPESCALGNACKFVHADTTGARVRRGAHVNYAWRNPDDCMYPCFKPGQHCSIAPPNGKVTSDVIASHLLLKTKALGAKRRPLSHCAHYYFNRACNLGAECQFIHAVFIDPEARKYQLAPAPVQLGRVDHRDAVKRIEARRANTKAASTTGTPLSTATTTAKKTPPLAPGHHAHFDGEASILPHLPKIEVTMHHIAPDPAAGTAEADATAAGIAGATTTTTNPAEGGLPRSPPQGSPYLRVNTSRPGSATPPTVGTLCCGRSRASSTASLMSARGMPALLGQPVMPSSTGLHSMYNANESFNGSFSDDSALPAAAAVAAPYDTPVLPLSRRTPSASTRYRRDPYCPFGTPVMITSTPSRAATPAAVV